MELSRRSGSCPLSGEGDAGAESKAQNGLAASPDERKGSHRNQDISSRSVKTKGYSKPELPEDIWYHIHSLLSLRDAARAACVSRAFLYSWRQHSNLTFSNVTLGLKRTLIRDDEVARAFTKIVDHILKNHSGVGVKTLRLLNASNYYLEDRYYLDSWLKKAITPGIEELAFTLFPSKYKYNFPCSLLSNGNGDSIRNLYICNCALRPTVGLGCLTRLTSLNLGLVHITGDELGCLLSNSFALERLVIRHCSEIICLKIPCLLRNLSYLEVFCCNQLKIIESKAPNLYWIVCTSDCQVQLSLGEQVRNLSIDCPRTLCYTRTELASNVPNLETLVIKSSTEIWQRRIKPVSFSGAPLDVRKMPEQTHRKLRNVKICGFSSAKSLFELVCHILGSTTSLKLLILDTIPGHDVPRCSASKFGKCVDMGRDNIVEAYRVIYVVNVYIRLKVPSTVNLEVLGPCTRCHL